MWILIVTTLLFALVSAGLPPTPSGIKTLQSKLKPGASISYKETYICETLRGVKAYSGYVHLPATILDTTYNVSTFFWYFEARKKPQHAPLVIYLAGGPGESSLVGAAGMGGPCYVNEDSNSTTLNPWSWNNVANVLYIDQPVQTGFSYDSLMNGTYDVINGIWNVADFTNGVPESNSTFFTGTITSQDPTHAANNSVQAALALYQFSQVWINDFPEYSRKSKNSKINLWVNSWGGFYGPAFAAYIVQQNEMIAQGHLKSNTILNLEGLGLLNACVDPLYEAPHYPQLAFNNTYDFPVITEDDYFDVVQNFTMSGGCRDMILQCRSLAAEKDPQFNSNDSDVNQICSEAFGLCFATTYLGSYFGPSNRSAFDFAQILPDPYPYSYLPTFFNQYWVQEALGVPVNFTISSNIIPEVWVGITGDAVRGNISNIEYLLGKKIKIDMIYGDRDYRCNWLGAENVSLSLEFPGAADFQTSGYEELETNSSYVGGLTRQAQSLSFNRIFESGHFPHATQPETVYRILERSLSGLAISTGKNIQDPFSYHTDGPDNTWAYRNILPASPSSLTCSLWVENVTCTDSQTAALVDGSAIVENFIVKDLMTWK